MIKILISAILIPLFFTLNSPLLTSAQTAGYSIMATPTASTSGGAVAVTWTAPSTHSSQDWIGLFLAGYPSAGNTIVTYKYVPSGTSGILSFTVPNVTTAQNYEFRYFLSNTFTTTATSNVITVSKTGTATPPPSTTPPPPPPSSTSGTSTSYSILASPVTIPPGGLTSVVWRAPSTHTAKDWVGLFLVGKPTAGNTIVTYRYVPSGTSGVLTFTAPNTTVSQTYEFRYLLNDGFTEAARSNAVTVTSSAKSTSPPPPPSTTPPPPPSTTPPPPPPPPPATSTGGSCANGAPLAFEGAEGFGRCAQGGRGGRTIDVTNLNNNGPGSLRQCAEVETGPRICRTTVPGIISLGTWDILVRNDYLTIDGSAAPVTLKDGGITVRASHVIIRHLRVRPGPASLVQRGSNANGITLMSRENGTATTDIIVDHCSMSWGTDDLMAVFYGTDNVTIQDSIMSEGLTCEGCGSRGLLIGNNAKRVSVLRTLNAHNFIRFPNASSGDIDFVNNVDYNGNGSSAQVVPFHSPVHINFVGNYWKDGPSAVPFNLGYKVIRTVGSFAYSPQSGIYVKDNIGRSRWTGTAPETDIIWSDNGGVAVQAVRYPYPQMTTTSALQAYEDVLSRSGAQPRDSVDARVVADVRNGTGTIISSPLQVGGWPSLSGGTP